MNIIILGAAGFIGINLTLKLAENLDDKITLVDINKDFFQNKDIIKSLNVKVVESDFMIDTDFERLLEGQDIVYHLVSTTVPTTSNQHISKELTRNVVTTSKMLEACIKCGIKKVIFISSGGTVYGKDAICPIKEDSETNPITSYGVQKITIEKLLYLYQYMYNLDYKVIRLANPYGPYQRPNGILGAVTTFIYKALKGEEIIVYGDGSVIRDFIYIDDAIKAIVNIANSENEQQIFNLGCGYGTSINQVLDIIRKALDINFNIIYKPGRKVDVSVNYLDITKYENIYGDLKPISLYDGIVKTAEFIRENYKL